MTLRLTWISIRTFVISHNSLSGPAVSPWKILIGIAPIEKCFLGVESDASNGEQDIVSEPYDDHLIPKHRLHHPFRTYSDGPRHIHVGGPVLFSAMHYNDILRWDCSE